MTVEISYFQRAAGGGLPIARDPFSSESVSITSTPALSGATPDDMTAVSMIGTEPFRYEYTRDGSTGVTATSHYVATGERMWITPRSRGKFSLRTP